MRGTSPAWFVAALLAMLAVLMAAHLALLWLGALECDEYARLLFDHRRQQLEQGTAPSAIEATNAECSELEQVFADTAAQYIAVILALLSGAGFAAGQARRNGNGPPDRPGD